MLSMVHSKQIPCQDASTPTTTHDTRQDSRKMSNLENLHGWTLQTKVAPSDRLMQGDLVQFASESDPLKNLGLVVTADCDLKKNKHGRLITLVPVVEAKVVLERYLLLEECDKKQQNFIEYLRKTFATNFTLDDPVSIEELRSNVKEKEMDGAWKVKCLAAKLFLNEVDHLTTEDYLDVMKELSIKVGSLKQKINDQLLNKGDLIILPSLSKMEIKADVAWVRQIWQVPIRQITLKNSDAKPGMGQKIAQLDSPFRYRVTQVMAQVFSDIGMPDIARDFTNELEQIFP